MTSAKISTTFFVISILLVWSCSEKKTEIVYPQPLPTGKMITFLPGVVSTDSFEFNSMFSPDGKSYFFSRNEIHNIYQTTFNGSTWSDPAMTSFSEKDYKECDPAFSPDGKRLYYISTRKRTPSDSTDDFDIWYVEKEGEGWSSPRNLEAVNSDSSEFYVSFADNGNLYFASNREGGYGLFDIYVSRFVNGEYTKPENLGKAVNDEHFEHDPFISRDERLLIYTSVNRQGGLGRGDLFYSVKDQNGNWSQAKNLGEPFSTTDYDFCPYISPDGKYFFFSDNKDIKWVNAEELYKITGK